MYAKLSLSSTPERTNTPEGAISRHLWGVLCVRRRPSLPHGSPCSTIGAERLNFRVRNGTGCFPIAKITETLWRCLRFRCLILLEQPRPYLGNFTVDA